MRFVGHTSADDEWIREEELGHCLEKVAEYDAAAPRRRAARRLQAPGRGPQSDLPPDPCPPPGFRFALPHEVVGGRALAGARMLYLWLAEGWQLGRVTRLCPRAGFSHVVSYGRSSALGAVVPDTLLDAASHGPQGRWLLLLNEGRA